MEWTTLIDVHRGKAIHMATVKIHFTCKVAHSTH